MLLRVTSRCFRVEIRARRSRPCPCNSESRSSSHSSFRHWEKPVGVFIAHEATVQDEFPEVSKTGKSFVKLAGKFHLQPLEGFQQGKTRKRPDFRALPWTRWKA